MHQTHFCKKGERNQEGTNEQETRTKNVDNGIDCSNDLQFSTGSCGDRFGE